MSSTSIVSYKKLGQLTVVFGAIAWIDRNNERKDYGDCQELKNSLQAHGWMDGYPVPVTVITEGELTSQMLKLESEWKRLKDAAASAKTNRADADLKVFEVLHTELINDQERVVRKPQYSANAAFRRASVYVASQVERYLNTKSPDDERDIKTDIPINVIEYATLGDKIIHQQLENEMQGTGTKKVEPLEKLMITRSLFDAGCIENKVRKLYSSTIGQKTFGICQANNNVPPLNIYNRFFETLLDGGKNNADWIPWGPVTGPDLVKLNNRWEATRKRKEGLRESDTEKALTPITIDEMDAYFRDKRKLVGTDGTGNAQKIMPKTEMEQKRKSHPLEIIRASMDSVLDNSEAPLAALIAHKEGLNTACDLIKNQGKGDLVDTVMDMTVKNEQLMKDFAKLLKDGKQAELRKALDLIINPPAPAPVPEVKVEPAPVDAKNGAKKSNREKVA